MKNNEQPKIYYRPLKQWIEVTEEEKRDWERFTGTHRKAMQRKGLCHVPLKKSYLCDGICENCEFRCLPNEEDFCFSIETELENVQEGSSSYGGFLSEESLVSEINVDLMVLRGLMEKLRESDFESYLILKLCAEGLPERVCAEKLDLPRNTYVYKRDKLLKELKKYF